MTMAVSRSRGVGSNASSFGISSCVKACSMSCMLLS